MGRDSKGRLRTDEPTVSVKVRLDKDTSTKLEEASGKLQVPKAEILRRGVHMVHNALKEQK